MADNYIDHDEVAIYGEYAVRMVRKLAMPLVPEFGTSLSYLATELENATSHVKELVGESREKSSATRVGTVAKGSALKNAVEAASDFSKHLSTYKPEEIDRKIYFVEDGTASGMGRRPARVLVTLNRIASQLEKDTCKLREREHYLVKVKAARDALQPVLENAESAKTDRAAFVPEVETARQAWLSLYTATKKGVECVLRLTGKLHLMPVVFHDLAVPANTKVTAIPPEPSVE